MSSTDMGIVDPGAGVASKQMAQGKSNPKDDERLANRCNTSDGHSSAATSQYGRPGVPVVE